MNDRNKPNPLASRSSTTLVAAKRSTAAPSSLPHTVSSHQANRHSQQPGHSDGRYSHVSNAAFSGSENTGADNGRQNLRTSAADPASGPAHARAANEFERARKHSARVRFLKLILPVAGVVAIIVIIASLFISGENLASVELGALRLEKGKLVMDSPELSGTDKNKRPYHLTALKAIQDAERPDRITLEQIEAEVPMSESQAAKITAGNGIYDAGAKTLELGGNIAVDTDDGMKLRLEDAQIDIATGTMRSDSPVEIDTGRANVKAESVAVTDNGNVIVFEKRVRMTILPFRNEGDNASAPTKAGKSGKN